MWWLTVLVGFLGVDVSAVRVAWRRVWSAMWLCGGKAFLCESARVMNGGEGLFL